MTDRQKDSDIYINYSTTDKFWYYWYQVHNLLVGTRVMHVALVVRHRCLHINFFIPGFFYMYNVSSLHILYIYIGERHIENEKINKNVFSITFILQE